MTKPRLLQIEEAIERGYLEWRRSLSPAVDEYIEHRVIDTHQQAFAAGWEAGAKNVFFPAEQEAEVEQERSRLPGSDPRHVCGVFCDGQDGRSSRCAAEKLAARKRLNVDVGEAYHNCPSCGWMGGKPCPRHGFVLESGRRKRQAPKRSKSKADAAVKKRSKKSK